MVVSYLSPQVRTIVRLAMVFTSLAMTTAAAVGTRTYVLPADKDKSAIAEKIAELTVGIENLRNIETQYLAISQQAHLTAVVDLHVEEPEARKAMAQTRLLALISRMFPIQQMIVQLAIAGREPGFKTAIATHEALVERCRQDFSLLHENEVARFETRIAERAQALGSDMARWRQALAARKSEADVVVGARMLRLLIAQAAGAAMLVLAYLV